MENNSRGEGLRFYPDDQELPASKLPYGLKLKIFSKDVPEFSNSHPSDIAQQVMRLLAKNQIVSINGLPKKRAGMLKDLQASDAEKILLNQGAFFFMLDENERSLGNLYLNRTGKVVDKARAELAKMNFPMRGGALADVGGFLVQDSKVLELANVKRERVIAELFLALQTHVRTSCKATKYLMVEVADNNRPQKRLMKQALARSTGADFRVFEDVNSSKFENQLCQRTVLCRKPTDLKQGDL